MLWPKNPPERMNDGRRSEPAKELSPDQNGTAGLGSKYRHNPNWNWPRYQVRFDLKNSNKSLCSLHVTLTQT